MLALLMAFALPPAYAADPGPLPPRAEKWSRERETEILDWVEERFPEKHDAMLRARSEDPPRYFKMLRRAGMLMESSDDDPKSGARVQRMSELDDKIRALTDGYAALKPAEQQKRRAEIRKLAEEMFDLRQELRRDKLKRLEQRLEDARKDVADRDAKKQQLIDEYLDEELGR